MEQWVASTCLGWANSELEPWNPGDEGVNVRVEDGLNDRKRELPYMREVKGYINTLWVCADALSGNEVETSWDS